MRVKPSISYAEKMENFSETLKPLRRVETREEVLQHTHYVKIYIVTRVISEVCA